MVHLKIFRDDCGYYIPGLFGTKYRLGANIYLDVQLTSKYIPVKVCKRKRWWKKPILVLHRSPFHDSFYMAGLDTSFILPSHLLGWKRQPRLIYIYYDEN